jgi:hypothetical protein
VLVSLLNNPRPNIVGLVVTDKRVKLSEFVLDITISTQTSQAKTKRNMACAIVSIQCDQAGVVLYVPSYRGVLRAQSTRAALSRAKLLRQADSPPGREDEDGAIVEEAWEEDITIEVRCATRVGSKMVGSKRRGLIAPLIHTTPSLRPLYLVSIDH